MPAMFRRLTLHDTPAQILKEAVMYGHLRDARPYQRRSTTRAPPPLLGNCRAAGACSGWQLRLRCSPPENVGISQSRLATGAHRGWASPRLPPVRLQGVLWQEGPNPLRRGHLCREQPATRQPRCAGGRADVQVAAIGCLPAAGGAASTTGAASTLALALSATESVACLVLAVPYLSAPLAMRTATSCDRIRAAHGCSQGLHDLLIARTPS